MHKTRNRRVPTRSGLTREFLETHVEDSDGDSYNMEDDLGAEERGSRNRRKKVLDMSNVGNDEDSVGEEDTYEPGESTKVSGKKRKSPEPDIEDSEDSSDEDEDQSLAIKFDPKRRKVNIRDDSDDDE